ncbi:hypothetical protein AWB72_02096 [Caballeronia concitans]|uniref:Uncharacterized protein n=1 Tax=Caballeronia concitans TaxID=1777133 RepID=A0A658QVW6_9BURK|nr:hypothetical protein BurMR1_4549 [Burkholderia sp. MR1]SAL26913.1 hypothetical protein AWB72_02096 [Caballeronia concitans]
MALVCHRSKAKRTAGPALIAQKMIVILAAYDGAMQGGPDEDAGFASTRGERQWTTKTIWMA